MNLLINGFQTFKKGVGDAFADAIMGAKSFGESIKALATTILHQLISGIVQLGVQLIVFKLFKKFTDEETNSMKKLKSPFFLNFTQKYYFFQVAIRTILLTYL